MGRGIPSAIESPRAALAAAERCDPRGHGIHVALAVLWAFLQSITNAGEGISWAMLLAITVLRAPRIWWCWAPAFRDPIWWVMVGWFAWTSLTWAWGPDLGASTPSAMPDRWLFTPLLLWPLLGRPYLLLGAIASGGLVHVTATLVLSWKGDGWETYEATSSLASIGTAKWQFASALVLWVAGTRWLRGWGRALAVTAAVPCALGVWILAVRTAMAAAAAGCVVAWLRPSPKARRARWTMLVSGVLALSAGSWLISRSPAWQRFESTLQRASELRDRGMVMAAIGSASGHRLTLMKAAWDIGWEHPVLGGGSGWFCARLPQWALVQETRSPRESELFHYMTLGSQSNAHNPLLHAWVDGGVPSVALLATLLAGIAWRLWCQSRTSALAGTALAIFMVILVNLPGGIVTAKTPGALIAVCLAVSWLDAGSSSRPRILEAKP